MNDVFAYLVPLPRNVDGLVTIQNGDYMSLLKIIVEQKERQKTLPGFSVDYRICGGHTYLKDSTVCNHNKMFAKLSGLHHIRLHDFRHSHVSYLIEQKINITDISKRLGHSNIQMTLNTYAHLYEKKEESTISALEKIFDE